MRLLELVLDKPLGTVILTLSICTFVFVSSAMLIQIIKAIKGTDEVGDEDAEEDS